MSTFKLWIERDFNTTPPVWMFATLLERLRGTPARIEDRVLALDEETLSAKDGESWSIKENIGHLISVEELWNKRLDDFASGSGELFPADMKNKRTEAADYNSMEVMTLLRRFRNTRLDLIKRFKDVEEDNLGVEAHHPRLNKPMSIVGLMSFAAEHDDHHLAAISKIIDE